MPDSQGHQELALDLNFDITQKHLFYVVHRHVDWD